MDFKKNLIVPFWHLLLNGSSRHIIAELFKTKFLILVIFAFLILLSNFPDILPIDCH